MKNISKMNPTLLGTISLCLYFSGTLTASAAALNIAQKPLILNESVAPNLVLTLDDSGSMRWAFVPDSINGLHNTRRAKSAYFNPMYYNPDVTYRIPPRYDTSGNIAGTPFSTSFTNAFNNGLNSNRGSYDLSNDYRVTWTYDPRGDLPSGTSYGYDNTSNRFATNPAPDFYFNSGWVTGPSTNTTSAPITINNVTFTVTRTNSGCHANITSQHSFNNIYCSRSGSNYRVTTDDLRTSGVPAYYYVYDEAQPNCTAIAENRKNDDNCYRRIVVSSTSGKLRKEDPKSGQDERLNFATWYSFYRNRALATLSAAQIAFADLPAEVRLTWQALGSCTSFTGNDGDCKDNSFKEYTNKHKGQLFSWFQDPPFSTSTYLRRAMQRAGEFYKTPTPWHKYPNDSNKTNDAGNTYACRPSYHIMMTDGIWNDNFLNPSDSLRADESSFTLPDGVIYDGKKAPFADNTSQTVADLAMHYWATDLNPNLANEMRPYIPFKNENAAQQYWDPRNDPATWQHMVTFTMGLGLTSSLSQSGLEWDEKLGTFGGTGYKNLADGSRSWPGAASGSVNNVYDLWHAAINSRGEFFSVDSPDAMVKAFKDILNRIADRTATAARPAVAASFVSNSDNRIQSDIYSTQFSSNDWSGQLSKALRDVKGDVNEQWNTKAANQGIDPNARKIYMSDPSNTTNKLKSFNWSNLGSMQALLHKNPESHTGNSDGRGEERTAYIRGDRTREGISSPSFRTRSTVIGDIINSSPVVVGTPAYFAYLADAIEDPNGNRAGYTSYAKFREDNRPPKRKEMVYVGANDGMLHGFNAATGQEEFAFIPTAVISDLYRLTGQNYVGAEHRYFVDGTPLVRDVYFDGAWHTILIGTLRAGGKALFALDITAPDSIKLLWEFDSNNDPDLGFTFPQPEIVRLHSGQWAVLMGNGYNSANDKAALLIIDIKTGALLKKLIVPDVIEGTEKLPNGLSSVRGADNNGDGLVDYAYAGDLQGNLWRFDLVPDGAASPFVGDPFSRDLPDLESVTVDDFKISYGKKPLFTARDSSAGKRQAITIQPSLVRHPSRHGYLVLVGTGKYIETSDANADASRAMTLYGIWDRNTKRQTTDGSTLRAESRANLQKQELVQQVDNATIGEEDKTGTNDIRLLTQNGVAWFKQPDPNNPNPPKIPTDDASVAQWGWALDLSVKSLMGPHILSGEMIINNMAARGRTLFLSSLTPNQNPCQAGADTWFYAIDAHTGGRTNYNVLDLNNDKVVSTLDAYGNTNKSVVSGVRFPALGGFTLAPGNQVFGSEGASDPTLVGDDPNTTGRQSWHIIPEEFQ